MNEIRRGHEELRNDGRPERTDRNDTDVALRSVVRSRVLVQFSSFSIFSNSRLARSVMSTIITLLFSEY
jgi:hypothetical protein